MQLEFVLGLYSGFRPLVAPYAVSCRWSSLQLKVRRGDHPLPKPFDIDTICGACPGAPRSALGIHRIDVVAQPDPARRYLGEHLESCIRGNRVTIPAT